MPPGALKPFANLQELEQRAKPLLTDAIYGYYASGSEGQVTLHENCTAMSRWRLLPRVLHNVSQVDTSCTVLGSTLSFPVLVAPMAMQRMCHPDGELAVARAAAGLGINVVLSTMATSSLDEVAAAAAAATGTGAPTNLWFQMYVLTRRDVSELMARRAEALGYTALVVTVDAPRLGKRDADARNKFSLPPGLSLKNLEMIDQAAGLTRKEEGKEGSPFARHFTSLIDNSLTWDFISWLKGATQLKVLVKGILAPDDARKAVEVGVDGIIVSNHGGRQLDTVPASIDVLPHIVRAVDGRVPVLIDGGIRRGTDVVKCLALGASAVLVGRPVLWALTLGGQEGVEEALRLLRQEVELSMALLGCRSVREITSEFVVPPVEGMLQLPASRL